MSWMLGIELTAGRLIAAYSSALSRGQAEVRAFEAPLPFDLEPANAEKLGKWLKEQLADRKIKATQAVVVLGRSLVSFKPIRLPVCPASELPAIVQFAAEGEWVQSGLAGDPAHDYQPGATLGEEQEVHLTLASASLVQSLVAMFKAAGLPRLRIGLRPYATQFAAESFLVNPVPGPMLIVNPAGDLLELSIWNHRQLTFWRSIVIHDVSDWSARVAAEVARTIGAYQAQTGADEIQDVVVVTHERGELAEGLKSLAGHRVHRLDLTRTIALSDGESTDRYVGAMGAAWRELAGAGWPIDLAHPKRPAPAISNRRKLLALAGAAALMVLISLFAIGHWLVSGQDERIATFQTMLDELKAETKAKAPVVARHKQIANWVSMEIDWLSEFRDLATLFPDTQDAYLTNIDLSAPVSQGRPGTIKLQGRARRQEIVTQFQNDVATRESTHFRVSPKSLVWSESGGAFQWSFDLDILVTPLSAKEYRSRAEAALKAGPPSLTPKGMRRVPERISAPRPTTIAKSTPTPRSAPSATTTAPAAEKAAPSTTVNTTTVAPTATPAKVEAETSSEDGDDAVGKLVKTLKDLPYEEREKRIEKMPQKMQPLIRKRLEESRQ